MNASPKRVLGLRLVALIILAVLASATCASADSSHEYHEVLRFGGFDKEGFKNGSYGEGGPQSLTPGKFLEATGFAVDPEEEPEEAIYVADRTSRAEGTPGSQECVSEGEPGTCWRIQKLGAKGQVLGTTTFTLPAGRVPTATKPKGLAAYAIDGLAVDHAAGRLYALVVGPLKEKDLFRGNATAAVELLAWSTKPEACPAEGCPATGGRLVAAEHLNKDPLGTTGGLISTRAQLEAGHEPLYDPQGIVVDHVNPRAEPGNPVAIEAEEPDAERQKLKEKERAEGKEEEEEEETQGETFNYSAFEARGNTIVQQVATEAPFIGHLEKKWSSATLKLDSGPLGIFDDTADEAMSVLLHGPEGATSTNAYVVRLPPELAGASVLNAGESDDEPPLMRLDPGPFFTEPNDRFALQRSPEAIRGAGPEAAQLETGLYAADLHYEEPAYWRAERRGVNVGVRLLQPLAGRLADDSHGASIVNTLGNSEPWSEGDKASACNIGAEEPALAAGGGGRLWVLDRGPSSETLEGARVPESQWGHQVLELAPSGSGEEPLACPRPSGSFTMALACGSSEPAQGTFEVPAGVPVKFDASSVDLKGGTPAAYQWTIVKLNVQTHEPEGKPEPYPTEKLAEEQKKPFSVAGFRNFETFERTFGSTESGTYRVSLKASSDYGAYEQSRELIVTPAEAGRPRAQFSVESLQGARATFNAERGPSPGEEGSSPGICNTLADYRWNWGEGRSLDEDDDTPVVTHTYASIGETRQYTVTLTVLAREVVNGKEEYLSSAPVTHTVTVSAAPQLRSTELLEVPPALAGGPGGGAPAALVPVPAPVRGPTDLSPHASFSGGVLSARVSCPPAKLACAGTVQVETVALFPVGSSRSAKGRGRRRLVLGEAAFNLAGGRSGSVTVRLTATGAALLRRQRHLAALVIVSAHDPVGDPGVASARFTLVAPAAKPHRARNRS